MIGLLGTALMLQAQEKPAATVLSDLRFMYAEEQLARDVYDSLFALWAVNPFGNIRHSERRHMETVQELLEKYGQPVPAVRTGVFPQPELQALYRRSVQEGTVSLPAALRAGARVEEADIRDLKVRMARTTAPDVLEVFQYLLEGSERHLAAFSRRLRAAGEVYQPVILDQDEYQKIIDKGQP